MLRLTQRLIASSLFAAFTAAHTQTVQPQISAPQHKANFEAERTEANSLFLAGRILESLPLYEDLCKQDQTIAVFAERHAHGLVVKSGLAPDEATEKKLQAEATKELLRAQSLGDNSPYVQNMLSVQNKTPLGAALSNIPLTIGYTHVAKPEAVAALNEAEKAFNNGDFSNAAMLYAKAAQLDPAWYLPKLYAGDVYFRTKDPSKAGEWYSQAIAVDPDRDTAYRYWADAMMQSGSFASARGLCEKAVIAEPYSRPSWNCLQAWSMKSSTPLLAQQIARPNFTTNAGKLVIDPSFAADLGDGRSSWLVYEQVRVAHGAPTLVQTIVAGGTTVAGVLTPSGYRHSLAEEMDAITQMLASVQQKLKSGLLLEANLDQDLKTLLRLQRDNMLECWILLNAYDSGTRQDYFSWRPEHRDLLLAYLDKYVIGIATAH